MDKIFLYLLERILKQDPEVGLVAHKRRQESILTLLQWAFHSTRPLTLKELQDAVFLPQPDSEGTGINVVRDTNQPMIQGLQDQLDPLLFHLDDSVQITYTAFKDLVCSSEKTGESSKIAILLADLSTQARIARQCLYYRSQEVFDLMDFLPVDKASIDERHPLFQCAYYYWVTHLINHKARDPKLQACILEFLATDQAITQLHQWMKISKSKPKVIQTQLYTFEGYLPDPEWILNLLVRSVDEACSR